MIALQTIKHFAVTMAGGAALAAGLAVLLVVGLVAALVPAGLTLLYMAFGKAWRRLRSACSLSRKETLP